MSEFSPLWGGNEGCGACDDEEQDKDLASQAPPGRPRLPAVRAVSGVRKLASLTGGKRAVGVSFPTKPRVAGFLPMSV